MHTFARLRQRTAARTRLLRTFKGASVFHLLPPPTRTLKLLKWSATAADTVVCGVNKGQGGIKQLQSPHMRRVARLCDCAKVESAQLQSENACSSPLHCCIQPDL